jgi:hypothetical protein
VNEWDKRNEERKINPKDVFFFPFPPEEDNKFRKDKRLLPFSSITIINYLGSRRDSTSRRDQRKK